MQGNRDDKAIGHKISVLERGTFRPLKPVADVAKVLKERKKLPPTISDCLRKKVTRSIRGKVL